MDTSRTSRPWNTFVAGISRRAALGRLAGGIVAASPLAAAGRGKVQAQATPGGEEGGEANHFVLAGGWMVQVTYDTIGFGGEPQLTYRGPIGSGPIEERPIETRTIVGDEIGTEPILYLGRLVTGYLDAMPDAATFYLTLLLPDFNRMNLEAAPTPFATLAILTTVLTSEAGPGLIEGALQEYVAVPLEGTAEFVIF
jgi:hypothetical protein